MCLHNRQLLPPCCACRSRCTCSPCRPRPHATLVPPACCPACASGWWRCCTSWCPGQPSSPACCRCPSSEAAAGTDGVHVPAQLLGPCAHVGSCLAATSLPTHPTFISPPMLPPICRHAIWSQAATVGTLLLPPLAARRRRVSLQLCPTSGARYSQAAGALNAAVTIVLPPPMAVWVLAPQPLPGAAAFYLLTAIMQLLASFVMPLLWLARREWRARIQFARGQRDAAVVASLHRRARQWCLGPVECAASCAALWCIGLAVARAAASSQRALASQSVT